MAKTPNIDVSPAHWAIIAAILKRLVPDAEVWAFGSRAKWTARDTSDLDLALIADAPLPLSRMAELREAFSESDVPFKVDVVDWATSRENFRRIIEESRVVVQKNRNSTEWRIGLLGETAEVVMGQSPPSETCNSEGSGLPLLNGPTEFGPHRPFPVQYTEAAKKVAVSGDILFCVRGSTTGCMNWADQKYAIGRGIAAIRHREGKEYQPFLRGLIEYRLPELLAYATGSTFPNVSYDQISKLPCETPPLPTQRAIARILGALDDLIDLNRRTNETLEALTQRLFKSWFVEATQSALPKGWRESRLNEHVEVAKGLSYKGSGLANEGVPLHNLNSIYEGGRYKHEGLKHYTGEYKERHVCLPGDVIVANTEQGFDYQLIGYPAIVPKRYGKSGLFTHHIYRVRPLPNSPLTNHFIYLLLLTTDVREQVIGHTNGTTVNALAKSGLEQAAFPLPPAEHVAEFEGIVAPMFEQQENLYDESRTLVALRDMLLPKLMSGQIRVSPEGAE